MPHNSQAPVPPVGHRAPGPGARRRAAKLTAERRARSAHNAAENEFERYYRAACTGLVIEWHAILGDRARAEMLVREAFVRAWLSWPVVRVLPDPMGWVRRTADRLHPPRRHRSRTAACSAGRQAPATTSAPPLAVLDQLGRLPAVQRRMLVRHHMVGLSLPLLAEQESATVRTIRDRLTHGQLALARGLVGHRHHPDLELWRSAGRLDDWAAQELCRLGHRLALDTEPEPVELVYRVAKRHRRNTMATTGVLVAGLLGGSVAATLSMLTADAQLVPAAQNPAAQNPAAQYPAAQYPAEAGTPVGTFTARTLEAVGPRPVPTGARPVAASSASAAGPIPASESADGAGTVPGSASPGSNTGSTGPGRHRAPSARRGDSGGQNGGYSGEGRHAAGQHSGEGGHGGSGGSGGENGGGRSGGGGGSGGGHGGGH